MIVPSIDLMEGQVVQLVGGRERVLEAGHPDAWCERFGAVGEVAVVDLDAALGRGHNTALIEPLLDRARLRVGGGIRDLESAYRWIRAGAHKIVIGTAATPEFLRELPRDRVIVALDAVDGEVVVEGWRTRTGASIPDRMDELGDLVSGFLVTLVEREGRLVGTDMELAERLREAAGERELTLAGGIKTAHEVAALDRLRIDAQVGMALYDGSLGLADAFAAPLGSDRADGLWPTVVVDRGGRALGLVYSNLQSLTAALEERAGIYWSRARGLWRKGDTSGARQRLVRVDVDCDRDTLRFTVEQVGSGFCHTGTGGCWGDLEGLPALEDRIQAGRDRGPEKSYTARLSSDPALLAEKLAEEALELAEARSPEHVRWEAADLTFFISVALSRAGISWTDVLAELDRRAGVTHETAPPAERPDEGLSDAAPGPAAALRGASGRLLTLRPVAFPERADRPAPFSNRVLAEARAIVDAVRRGGDGAVVRYAQRFDGLSGDSVGRHGPEAMQHALERTPTDVRLLLRRTGDRIRDFAETQRRGLEDHEVLTAAGRMGHRYLPVAAAGCYVPGGRYPLPSSLLMTVIPARVARVPRVVVVSPRVSELTLATAAVAGADEVMEMGGAQAIAALAFGTESVAPVDLIAGPGNAWVTAAKFLVSAHVGIDMLAGPSEVLVVADGGADPAVVAADLIAQAEHDPEARPLLLLMDHTLLADVERELELQLDGLPTREIAERALRANGAVWITQDPEEVVRICDRLAPEHLQLSGAGPVALAHRFSTYGALFVGEGSAEVFGDYGAGPNHVLPTGGSARHSAGLSVLTFLRQRTWIDVADGARLAADSAALARLEGLEGHARAAERRG